MAADAFNERLQRLGLTRAQWFDLKEYLLGLQLGMKDPAPAGLEDHPVVKLAQEYRSTGNRARLDEAAQQLAGGKNAWLILMKA